MKPQKILIIVLFLITGLLTSAGLFANDPREIVSRMEENMRGDAMYSEMTMETVRPRYTREISMRSWSLGEEFSLIHITAPARDAGTAFLKRGNEIWNFVPNIDRTVKMPPSMMSQSWMGSDFSNDDLVRGISIVDDYTHKLLRTEMMDGHNCFVIEMIPHPDAPVVYDKVLYWISSEHYLPVRMENYDEFGDLASTMNFREIKEMGGRLIPTRMEMIPANREGHQTIMTTKKAEYDIDISRDFFTQQNMRNVR